MFHLIRRVKETAILPIHAFFMFQPFSLMKGVSFKSYILIFPSASKLCGLQVILLSIELSYRSSRPEVFYKKGVPRNVANFTRKHMYQRLATLLKKRLWHRCFPVNFANFLRTSFFIEHLWWLLLIKRNIFS